MPKPVAAPDDPWLDAILEYITEHPQQPLKTRALARELEVSDDEYPRFRTLIHSLLRDGRLIYRRNRALGLPQGESDALQGVFHLHRHGFGFVTLPGKQDMFIPAPGTADAHDGDTVSVRLSSRRSRHGGPAGEIVRVLKRAHPHWVGVAERSGQRWLVRPQGRSPGPLVLLDPATTERCVLGQMVVVEPAGPGPEPRTVLGHVVEVLGDPSRSRTKVQAVARRFGLPASFPADVRAYAETLTAHFDLQAAIVDREDLREIQTVTIDPADAKDFDDAISITAESGGGCELGVHIADVAWFVTPDSPLDREARERATSAYFPGYVVPMLPEALSNGLCSLRPGEDRLTRTAFIRYDAEGVVRGVRCCNSVIRSSARLVYEDVSAALAGEKARVPAEVFDLLRQAERLAQVIRKRRLANGMISLFLPEVYIDLDADGQIRDARPADTSFSHTMIEMFMVEANEAVCRVLSQRGIPHLRRIHPPPDPEGLDQLKHMIGLLGLTPPHGDDRRALQQLVDRVKGSPAETLVNYLLLRSFAPAEYSPDGDVGHFALASEYYCHFTSPIRRYPDLTAHRSLDAVIRAESASGAARSGEVARSRRLRSGRGAAARGSGHSPQDAVPELDDVAQLQLLGRQCTDAERKAESAEREAKQWLLLDLMAGKLGECFDALVTGVVSAGAFVQIQPHMAEGFVRLEDFGPGEWDFDEDNMRFIAPYAGRTLTLGHTCRVEVAGIDDVRREMLLVPESPATFGQPLHGAAPQGGTRKSSGRGRPGGQVRGRTPGRGGGGGRRDGGRESTRRESGGRTGGRRKGRGRR